MSGYTPVPQTRFTRLATGQVHPVKYLRSKLGKAHFTGQDRALEAYRELRTPDIGVVRGVVGK